LKLIKCYTLIPLFFLLFSCVTENSLYTANAPDNSQLYFLRPTQIKVKKENLKSISFDITVYIKEKKLVGNPILNCTYFIPIKKSNDMENFVIEITDEENSLSINNKKQLVKNIIKNKYIEIRYSYELNNDEFFSLLQSEKPAKIKLIFPDGKAAFFDSDEFNEKLDNLRILAL